MISMPRPAHTVTLLAGLALAATGIAVPLANAADSTSTASRTSHATLLPTTGLNILLTDDDGWDAPGIQAVYAKLTAAGHHVTMVAPASNYSGVSAQIAFSGTLDATEQEPGMWSVSTSPAGTVFFGINEVLKATGKPDLVVSGTNVGSNTGFDTNFSGTIGAATVAAGYFDVPAIAISTEASGYGSGATGPFDETADLLVDMIGQGIPDLPRGQFINVNYPLLTANRTEPAGVRYTSTALASATALTYSLQSGSTYKIVGARNTETPAAGSDMALLKDGYVTVSVLESDRSVAVDEVPEVAGLIRKLTGEKEPTPPTVPPVKVSVEKLVKRAASGTTLWVKATGLDGKNVTVTWKPAKKKGYKTVTRTAKVSGGLFRLTVPAKAGQYQVKVKASGKALRTSGVKVL